MNAFGNLMEDAESAWGNRPSGAWALEELVRGGSVSFANFGRSSGEFLMLAFTGGVYETFLGRSARGVTYGLANRIDPETGGVSTHYQLACLGEGTERLRARLGLPGVPLIDVVSELSERIYRSGQYPQEMPSTWASVTDLQSGRRYLLDPAAIPASLTKINAGMGNPDGADTGVLFPEAFAASSGEYLGLQLDDPSGLRRGEPMPLVPELQTGFWDFAEILTRSLSADPS